MPHGNDEKDEVRKTVGMFIGPTAKNIKTFGVKISGADTGIEDHGQGSFHAGTKIRSSAIDSPKVKQKQANDPTIKQWYEKPLGQIVVGLAIALLGAAALAAIGRYLPPI